MRVSYEFYSDIGKRKKNEDAIGISENRIDGYEAYLFSVADGAGNERGSQIAIETLSQVFPKEDASKQLLPGMFQLAERMIVKVQEMERYPEKSFRTTLSSLQLDCTNRSFCFAHTGDTRIYAFRNHKLFTKTFDHSIAQKMVLNGQMSELLLRTSQEKNQITRLLGVGMKKPWDASEVYELRENMSFLVCSDGFWNYIYENEMEDTLAESEFVGEWLAKMKQIVTVRGMEHKMDNHSAIAVFTR